MNLVEARKHIEDIIKYDFDVRNIELERAVTSINQIMNSRNLMYSSITLNHISMCLEKEFEERCKYIMTLILNLLGKVNLDKHEDPVGDMKTLYQELSFVEKSKAVSKFNDHLSKIGGALKSNMPDQIDSIMKKCFDNNLRKNNSIIHLEYQSYIDNKKKREIFFIRPQIYGMGFDIKELIRELKENITK